MLQRAITPLFAGALALGLVALTTPARAEIPLPPGTPPTSPGPATTYNNGASPVAPGAVEVASQTVSPQGGVMLGTTIIEQVYRETGGTYDFLYQIVNGGVQAITTATIVNFSFQGTAIGIPGAGYTTTVPTQAIGGNGFSSGAVAPTTVDRTPTPGTTVDYNFSATNIGLGQTSNILYIRTSATSFDNNGQFQVSGTTNSNTAVVSYEPTISAVPEPSAMMLAGVLGALGCGVAAVRKRSAR